MVYSTTVGSATPSPHKTPMRATTPSSIDTIDTMRSRARTPEQRYSRPQTATRPSPLLLPARSASASSPVSPFEQQRVRAASGSPKSEHWRDKIKKPKVFSKDDFNMFLARQDQHKAMQAQNHIIPRSLIQGLRPCPLLPIMCGGYAIQGATYIEADPRDKQHQGKIPAWRRGGLKPVPANFHSFLHKQWDALERKKKCMNSSTVAVEMPKRTQAEIQAYIEQKQIYLAEKRAMIARQQEEEIEAKRMATEWARRLNSKETVQTPEFLDRNFTFAHEIREALKEEALKSWKTDYPFEAGESRILDNNKVITIKEAVEIYKRMSTFPNIANREPPNKEPKEFEPPNFRTMCANPYQGGKSFLIAPLFSEFEADWLKHKLGERAGVEPLPSRID